MKHGFNQRTETIPELIVHLMGTTAKHIVKNNVIPIDRDNIVYA